MLSPLHRVASRAVAAFIIRGTALVILVFFGDAVAAQERPIRATADEQRKLERRVQIVRESRRLDERVHPDERAAARDLAPYSSFRLNESGRITHLSVSRLPLLELPFVVAPLASLAKLKSLELNGKYWTAADIEAVVPLVTGLEELDLSDNAITPAGLSSFGAAAQTTVTESQRYRYNRCGTCLFG